MGNPEEAFKDRLRREGLRITPDRVSVFRLLAATGAPLSITQIGERLTSEGVNQATVYRILELFTALGVAHPVLIGHATIAYELIPPFRSHHHHLLCTRCGEMIDLMDCGLDQLIDRMVEEQGYRVTYHDLEVHGVCVGCQSREPGPDRKSVV